MGPIDFIAYIEENVENIDSKTVTHYFYADDIQLLAKMQIASIQPINCELENTVSTQHCWCSSRRLRLNPGRLNLSGSVRRATVLNC